MRVVAAILTVGLLVGCTASPSTPSAPDPETSQAGTTLSLAALGERAAHTATSLPDGRVLVAGGCVVDGCTEATARTAIVSTDGANAVEGPSMATARTNHTASLLPDGRVVIAGGFLGENQGVSGSMEMFDPISNSFASLPDLHQPRGGHVAAVLADGRLLVVGGWIAPHRYTGTAELIDPVAGTVSAAEPLPWAADALDAALLADGHMLVTGGQAMQGAGSAEAAVFDPEAGHWTSTGPMATPRMKHATVALADGRALVIGGTSDDTALLASTELYDPASGRFHSGPTMHEPRYKLPGGALVFAADRVLVVGGGRTAEILDVSTGQSEVIGTADGRAAFATVSALPSRAALIIGGYDDHIRLAGRAEVIELP